LFGESNALVKAAEDRAIARIHQMLDQALKALEDEIERRRK
jgi:hypothetical protein